MITLKVDNFNNFLTENNDLILIDNLEQVAQKVARSLKINLGDLSYNINVGLPYTSSILTNKLSVDAIKVLIANIVLSVDGVIEIITLTANNLNNIFTFKIVYLTVFGEKSYEYIPIQ